MVQSLGTPTFLNLSEQCENPGIEWILPCAVGIEWMLRWRHTNFGGLNALGKQYEKRVAH